MKKLLLLSVLTATSFGSKAAQIPSKTIVCPTATAMERTIKLKRIAPTCRFTQISQKVRLVERIPNRDYSKIYLRSAKETVFVRSRAVLKG